MVNALRHLLGDKVAGRLLHGDLALDGVGHVVAIPAQSALVVPVEEVHLGAGGAHIRMQPYELQQGPRAALLHADDQRVGQMARGTQALLAQHLILGRAIDAGNAIANGAIQESCRTGAGTGAGVGAGASAGARVGVAIDASAGIGDSVGLGCAASVSLLQRQQIA